MLYYLESNIEQATCYINSFCDTEEEKVTTDDIRSLLFLGYSENYPEAFSYGGLCFFYQPMNDEDYSLVGHIYVSLTTKDDLDSDGLSVWSEADGELVKQIIDYEENGRMH